MLINLDNEKNTHTKKQKNKSNIKMSNSSRGMVITDEGINATLDELCMIYLLNINFLQDVVTIFSNLVFKIFICFRKIFQSSFKN